MELTADPQRSADFFVDDRRMHAVSALPRRKYMKVLLAVVAGGAGGAPARHFVNNQIAHWLGDGFPWGILFANVAESLAVGVLAESLALVRVISA